LKTVWLLTNSSLFPNSGITAVKQSMTTVSKLALCW
jgi:hypothetical protein